MTKEQLLKGKELAENIESLKKEKEHWKKAHATSWFNLLSESNQKIGNADRDFRLTETEFLFVKTLRINELTKQIDLLEEQFQQL